MLLELSNNKTFVLIDTSYYVFYRYFATMRWFGFQKKEFDLATITENEEYISSFLRHMESDIKKICKKWRTDVNNVIFCTDCQRCDIWRNDLYKDYKGSRVQNLNFNNNIFPIVNDYIARKNIKKVSFSRLEADDIIYLIQKQLKKIADNDIVIISNDNDYLQLADDRTNIINMQFKDITLRGNKNANVDLYQKAIYGDKSDNILKISSNITKEKALEISLMPEKEMKQWLEKNNLMNQFNFNMSLISFKLIPKEYVDTFYNSIELQMCS